MDEEERDAQSGEVSSLGYHIVPDEARDTWTLSDLQHQVHILSLSLPTGHHVQSTTPPCSTEVR